MHRINVRTVMNDAIKKLLTVQDWAIEVYFFFFLRKTYHGNSLVTSNYARCLVSVDNIGLFHLKKQERECICWLYCSTFRFTIEGKELIWQPQGNELENTEAIE